MFNLSFIELIVWGGAMCVLIMILILGVAAIGWYWNSFIKQDADYDTYWISDKIDPYLKPGFWIVFLAPLVTSLAIRFWPAALSIVLFGLVSYALRGLFSFKKKLDKHVETKDAHAELKDTSVSRREWGDALLTEIIEELEDLELELTPVHKDLLMLPLPVWIIAKWGDDPVTLSHAVVEYLMETGAFNMEVRNLHSKLAEYLREKHPHFKDITDEDK